MSQSTVLQLLPQTAYEASKGSSYTVTGNTTPAAAYYLGNQDLQTVSYNFTEVTGNLVIEASLASTPADSDWFKVHEVVANNEQGVNANVNSFTNLTGNFTYMRAKIDAFQNGTVQFVKISY